MSCCGERKEFVRSANLLRCRIRRRCSIVIRVMRRGRIRGIGRRGKGVRMRDEGVLRSSCSWDIGLVGRRMAY